MARHPNLIGGEWRTGEPFLNINPSDLDDIIGEYARATVEDCREAIAAARSAGKAWGLAPPQTRADLLYKVAAGIEAEAGQLADLLAREEGKTLREAAGEVLRAVHLFRFYAGEALRGPGERYDSSRPGIEIQVTREPVGVVGLITPWNFPLGIPAWKIAPALAWGNAVVLKPADLVPGCAWELARIIHEAGVPPGVFNLVMGRGSVVGAEIIDNPGVDAVSFTGSVQTGAKVLQGTALRGAKVQMEMGGKNPLVVLADADIDRAVQVALDGAYYGTGQRCTASSRLIVEDAIHDKFVAGLTKALAAQVVDDARKPGTTIGPVVDQRQYEQDLRYLDIGRGEAQLAWGGMPLERATRGYYLQPALFTEARNDMTIARDEIFGPVAAVIRVRDYEEALAIANDTPFGLSAGICTTSLKYAQHFRRHAQAGMVMVNCPTAGVDYTAAFGGRKASSYGSREQGRYAVEFYTTVKTAYQAI
ncbi:MAG: aldehyde dehydrogenase family protein [Pigmentiphaga sp.]|uniref:aldehyde dehydrogenase family protein n=1 Tax=Pigmentiphaga sp. TaxID=1977564 RepID=UPI0029A5A554|nr:aldehyde dehydrogenase family protein [Pigmentiphaga sp.]MDX3904363.1 aldehyde dehydrogenase family protein [Pigmentiphaga sp.]